MGSGVGGMGQSPADQAELRSNCNLVSQHTRHQTPDTLPVMSEDHFDQYEYYNFEEKLLSSRNTGKQRSKKEAALNTNRHSPGGHERKIVTKLRNTERNKKQRKQSKQKIVC